MPTLGTPSSTIEVLQKYNFNFQKKFGQNFLIEPNVLRTIVDAAGVGPDDCVLEIGPGIGTMTQYLAERAGSVIAVEIDKALIPILGDTLSSYDNVTVINEDILKLDINALAQEKNNGKPFKVVANLPYYITTPIIMQLFESHVPLSSITIMVQTEVAERIQVGPGTKDYGALSLAVQYYSRPQIVTHVPPTCFMPRPNVGSTVIRLDRYEEPPVRVADEAFLFSVIRASFNQRRKTLVNGLNNAAGLPVSKEQVAAALEQMGLPATVRGETLTLEQFARLSDLLCRKPDQIKAVVFDMDGILFDTERLSVECWRQTAAEMGLGDIEEGVYGCIGLNRTDSRIFLEKTYGKEFPYDEFRQRNSAVFRERVEQDGLPIMKGTKELLSWLKEKGVRVALASSTAVDTVKSHLARAGFTDFFEVVIGGDMVEHSKPQADIYLKACALLGVEPSQAAAIEDSPNGIRSAHGAGMRPIMVPDLVAPTPELEKLLYKKCDSLADVLDFFREIF